jgi:peptide-methionine (S)-S-oxide reductase
MTRTTTRWTKFGALAAAAVTLLLGACTPGPAAGPATTSSSATSGPTSGASSSAAKTPTTTNDIPGEARVSKEQGVKASNGAAAATGAREMAVFGLGCFWSPELKFAKIPGVIDAEVGYAGGVTQRPTYEEVCTGETGHAEVVRITYDPAIVTYQQLLDTFFAVHDPTQKNRQGPDIGTQYRSVIIPTSDAQAEMARATIAKLTAAGTFRRPIATTVEPPATFWRAEEYHQDYLKKRGMDSCPSGG